MKIIVEPGVVVELGVGIVAIGALGYTIYWQRERMKLVRTREKQIKRLKRLKRTLEREK